MITKLKTNYVFSDGPARVVEPNEARGVEIREKDKVRLHIPTIMSSIPFSKTYKDNIVCKIPSPSSIYLNPENISINTTTYTQNFIKVPIDPSVLEVKADKERHQIMVETEKRYPGESRKIVGPIYDIEQKVNFFGADRVYVKSEVHSVKDLTICELGLAEKGEIKDLKDTVLVDEFLAPLLPVKEICWFIREGGKCCYGLDCKKCPCPTLCPSRCKC